VVLFSIPAWKSCKNLGSEVNDKVSWSWEHFSTFLSTLGRTCVLTTTMILPFSSPPSQWYHPLYLFEYSAKIWDLRLTTRWVGVEDTFRPCFHPLWGIPVLSLLYRRSITLPLPQIAVVSSSIPAWTSCKNLGPEVDDEVSLSTGLFSWRRDESEHYDDIGDMEVEKIELVRGKS